MQNPGERIYKASKTTTPASPRSAIPTIPTSGKKLYPVSLPKRIILVDFPSKTRPYPMAHSRHSEGEKISPLCGFLIHGGCVWCGDMIARWIRPRTCGLEPGFVDNINRKYEQRRYKNAGRIRVLSLSPNDGCNSRYTPCF